MYRTPHLIQPTLIKQNKETKVFYKIENQNPSVLGKGKEQTRASLISGDKDNCCATS